MDFQKDESKTYDLSKLPGKVPDLSEGIIYTPPKTWSPNGSTQTVRYGHGEPSKSISLRKLAEQQVNEAHTHVIKGSDQWERLVKEVLVQYIQSTKNITDS